MAGEDEDQDGVSLEEILIAIVDAQLEIVEAVSTGKPLTDAEELKLQLHDIREMLDGALPDDDG